MRAVDVSKLDLKSLGKYCQAQCRATSLQVWKLGRALVAAKALVPHGEWKPWLQKNCPGHKYSTCMRYKLFAERQPKPDKLHEKGITDSYRKAGITNLSKKRDERKAAVTAMKNTVKKLKVLSEKIAELRPLVVALEKKLQVLS